MLNLIGNTRHHRGRNQTLHQFDIDTILVATENFFEANRIPHSKTYGSLYKGKLQSGQGIAVSKIHLSDRYECFMKEVPILVMLEHENLSKLLGYCTRETRLFLVYDFAPHTTLDRLMFGWACTTPNWDKRYKILLGVARALLYLHRDAPIRIIHGDVKPGNVLLDENLNPMLSGFLNTRYLDINQTDCYLSTNFLPWRYMAPEYMCYANVSTKADVYSFGVFVLEAIIKHSSSGYSFLLKYIGLLCTQKDAEDRPTMEEVVSMLLDSSSLTPHVAKTREMITRECSNTTSVPVDNYDVDD
ncbi:cysteine-rich receptor-like protein kinase 19 [Bidens hawaiensis]|uniref:cysteine-rich receptor-like protein kinase 19 n=1 Tax=Bidens hawaiensis TaxID=980011 RepID=UPI00404A9A36